jgi:hypothetical protein
MHSERSPPVLLPVLRQRHSLRCRELRNRCHRRLRLPRHARPSMGRATRKLSSTPTLVATPSGTPPQLPVLSETRCLCLHLHPGLASVLPKTGMVQGMVATCEATMAAVTKSARQTGKRSTDEGIDAAEVRRVHPAHEVERRVYGEWAPSWARSGLLRCLSSLRVGPAGPSSHARLLRGCRARRPRVGRRRRSILSLYTGAHRPRRAARTANERRRRSPMPDRDPPPPARPVARGPWCVECDS